MKRTISISLMVLAATLAGCQQKADRNSGPGSTAANSTPPPTAAANTGPSSPDKADMTGYSLASPSDAYRTAFEARKKCDIAVMKRVMSEPMTEALIERGESDPTGQKTLDDMLRMLCELPAAPNGEIKDEKTVGDEGTLKFKDETGEWRLMDFARENGEWKLTLPRGKNELPALK